MEELLQEIGLTEKQAKVYLACLELGKGTVFVIAKKAELKRPTVYLVLADLAQKGLVSVNKTPKATFYSSVHPKKLLTGLKAKEKRLEESLVDLESIYNLRTQKPNIRTFEGIKNVENIYDEVADYARSKGKEVLAVGTVAFLETVHQTQYRYWLEKVKSKKAHIREILNDDKYNIDYLKTIRKYQNPHHKVRFTPQGYKLFKNDNLIYGNKMALFSSHKDFFVIVIESENIVSTFKTLFEFAWETATPVK